MDDRGSARQRAILIAGPTASGKSALALGLAEALGGTVINADSMQVYADLAVLTARPTEAEMARAPHRLFGHVDAAEAYSVGRWLADMEAALVEARSSGRLAVIVGGTGLYLKALFTGLSPIPPVPDAIRAEVRAESIGIEAEELHARLTALDPAMAARLRPSDPQRIIRALEVHRATGQSLLVFQQSHGEPVLPAAETAGVYLAPDRAALNDRIDRRFDGMMAHGALTEVARLARRNLDPALPAMRALGVPPLLAHLRGEMTLEDAVARGKLLTRHYAKRQGTFARHQLPDLPWVSPELGRDVVLVRYAFLEATLSCPS